MWRCAPCSTGNALLVVPEGSEFEGVSLYGTSSCAVSDVQHNSFNSEGAFLFLRAPV